MAALGGHCLLIHGTTDVGSKMLESDNRLVTHFANLLQCRGTVGKAERKSTVLSFVILYHTSQNLNKPMQHVLICL